MQELDSISPENLDLQEICDKEVELSLIQHAKCIFQQLNIPMEKEPINSIQEISIDVSNGNLKSIVKNIWALDISSNTTHARYEDHDLF